MNCKELTTFLQKVLDKKGMIYDPQDGQLGDVQELIDEIEKVFKEETPYNRNIRFRLKLAEQIGLMTYVGDFHDGWALAKDQLGNLMYVNKEGEFLKGENGEVIIPSSGDRFSEGLAAVIDKNALKFLKPDGSFLAGEFSGRTSDITFHRFSNGLARVEIEDTKKYFLKSDGNLLDLGDLYSYVGKMSVEGLARFMKKTTGEQGFINKRGNHWSRLPIPPENILSVTSFSEGFAAVSHKNIFDSKVWWSFIDDTGNFYRNEFRETHLDGEEIEAMDSLNCGWFKCVYEGGLRYGYINLAGESLKTEDGIGTFTLSSDFCEGLARVFVKNDLGLYVMRFIDVQGKYLRDDEGNICEFTKAEDFDDGLAKVTFDNGEQFYLTKTGELVQFGKQ